jgi:hypothetical protein
LTHAEAIARIGPRLTAAATVLRDRGRRGDDLVLLAPATATAIWTWLARLVTGVTLPL